MARHQNADGIDAAHSRQAQVHERDVGQELIEELNCLFATAGLGSHRHIGRGVDDGGDADTHDGVIVDDQDFDFRSLLHRGLLILPLLFLALFDHRVPPDCSSSPPGVKPPQDESEAAITRGRRPGWPRSLKITRCCLRLSRKQTKARQTEVPASAEIFTGCGHGSDHRTLRHSWPVVITSWYSGTRRMLSSLSIWPFCSNCTG